MNRPEKLARNASPHLASRMEGIEPFHVMALISRAKELEAQGRTISNMVVGEPDAPTPALIAEAGIRAIQAGRVGSPVSSGPVAGRVGDPVEDPVNDPVILVKFVGTRLEQDGSRPGRRPGVIEPGSPPGRRPGRRAAR